MPLHLLGRGNKKLQGFPEQLSLFQIKGQCPMHMACVEAVLLIGGMGLRTEHREKDTLFHIEGGDHLREELWVWVKLDFIPMEDHIGRF